MNVGLRWMMSGLALLTVACAGGGGTPAEGDGICRITPTEGLLPVEITMSEDAREVTVSRGNGESREIHTFDDDQRLVRTAYEGIPTRAATDFTYDAQGHMTAAMTFGEPGNTCDNTYDAQDRLTSRACRNETTTYTYDDSNRIESYTVTPVGGDARTYSVSYDSDDNIIAVEDGTSLYSYGFDSEGRPSTIERDWVFGSGKDGTSDIRWTWIYRDNGAVNRYEQDGTDHFDAPVIDGEPDLVWTFSADCDRIGDAHPWIYNQRSPLDVGRPAPSAL